MSDGSGSGRWRSSGTRLAPQFAGESPPAPTRRRAACTGPTSARRSRATSSRQTMPVDRRAQPPTDGLMAHRANRLAGRHQRHRRDRVRPPRRRHGRAGPPRRGPRRRAGSATSTRTTLEYPLRLLRLRRGGAGRPARPAQHRRPGVGGRRLLRAANRGRRARVPAIRRPRGRWARRTANVAGVDRRLRLRHATTTAAASSIRGSSTRRPRSPGSPRTARRCARAARSGRSILAAAPTLDDPALVAAVDAAHAVGYATGQTGCDEGAAAAAGAPPGSLTVSVYFGTEADARAAQAAFDERGVPSTVALVRTGCLD